jgi:predicted CopG family antitoxin
MVKTLTIRDDVYKKLVAIKKKDESFSELFERLSTRRGSLEALERLRGSIEFKNADEREAFLRLSTSKRDEKRS